MPDMLTYDEAVLVVLGMTAAAFFLIMGFLAGIWWSHWNQGKDTVTIEVPDTPEGLDPDGGYSKPLIDKRYEQEQ